VTAKEHVAEYSAVLGELLRERESCSARSTASPRCTGPRA
jgi:hypothetical protein